jgi:uncharacterized protein (DUF2236 family)
MTLRIADVSGEAILLAGGARAILLQLADPAVGVGVAEHSDFADRPLDRLHGTLTYLYVVVYGTDEERHRVAQSVGAAHAPVRSERYDARDPALQLWVASTLYETAMRMRELVHGPLDPADDAALLADYAMVGTALGLPASHWPADPDAFAAYWSKRLGELSVTAQARAVARELLHPSAAPWWLRALMPTVRAVTAGLLPPELRDAFGLVADELRFARFRRFARTVYPRLPAFIRHAPRRRYLRAFRSSRA